MKIIIQGIPREFARSERIKELMNDVGGGDITVFERGGKIDIEIKDGELVEKVWDLVKVLV